MDDENRDKPWNLHTCKLCPYRSKSVFLMCQHVRLHGSRPKTDTFVCDTKNLESFDCELCDFNSNLKVELTEHRRLFHEEKEVNEELDKILKCYICANCGFNTYSLLVLTGHVYRSVNSSKKKLQCGHCCYKTQYKNHLDQHILSKHLKPEDINWFKCEQCPYQTKWKYCLKNHTLAKHAGVEHITWFKCEKCPYQARQHKTLALHNLTVHIDKKDVYWFLCEHCSYKTKRKINFRKHNLLYHCDTEAAGWFKCAHCSYLVKSKSNLEKHISTKHDMKSVQSGGEAIEEVWFKCVHCPYKTTLQKSWKLHMNKCNKHSDGTHSINLV